MAKKIVRGITDVKTINNQDYDTNNVNDLLSDGQYNYIHRKKGKTEEYHNLTDNIKTISSDNTELLSVTNNNKTTNTATLHPKHDAQKEQVLESTRNTVTINHGTNGTAEKTTVDTNPKKVLEHEKLKTGDGLTTSFNTDETTIMFKATKKPPETNLNTLGEGVIRGRGFSIDQVPSGNQDHSAAYVTINTSDNRKVQFYIRESGLDHGIIKLYYRFIINGEVTEEVTEWNQMVGDSDELYNLLEQKQNKLTAGTGITIEGQTVDTNPQKVLEHDNLVSASEYITIEHEQQSEISKIKTDKLKNDMDELNKRIASVGVRNLLTKTNQGKINWTWNISSAGATVENYNVDGVNAVKMTRTTDASATWSYISYNGLIRKLIEPNTKYTLSFDVKPSVDVSFSAELKRSDGAAPLTNVANMNKATANKWTKVSCVLTSKTTLPDDLSQVVYLQGMPIANGNWLIIKNIKLEKGFIPSDWSPATEDVNALIAQKQDVLTAGEGITIQGNTISASAPAPGATVSIQDFSTPDAFHAYKHDVTIGQKTLTTFTFECFTETAEHVISGQLKEELVKFIGSGYSVSNGALTITNDGTTMKLINNKSTESGIQQATFTFYSGGGGAV